jgi:hypothetical protein
MQSVQFDTRAKFLFILGLAVFAVGCDSQQSPTVLSKDEAVSTKEAHRALHQPVKDATKGAGTKRARP